MLTPPFGMHLFSLFKSTLNRYSFAIHNLTADCNPYSSGLAAWRWAEKSQAVSAVGQHARALASRSMKAHACSLAHHLQGPVPNRPQPDCGLQPVGWGQSFLFPDYQSTKWCHCSWGGWRNFYAQSITDNRTGNQEIVTKTCHPLFIIGC